MKHINIFTQSSIKSPKAQDGRVIYLLESIYKGEPYTKHEVLDVHANWNEASLEAVRQALYRINQPAEIVIWTDCPYIEMNIDRAKQWKEENYEIFDHGKPTGEKRKYWELWDEIFLSLEGCKYKVTTGQNEYTHWLLSELKKRQSLFDE